ncbi:hypothetical protein PsYK624_066020 [Phanerochaete sordida]|uniref:Uncharacterized protein n=1 Tax=Phanerochaete sordida TaxID=48140 RepID=A0A9P3G930_9APHY|nr:hypothetical protein PsYK624_066020 [Phanerochaete sordida]
MDADQSDTQLLQTVQAMQANNYVSWAALALVLYDFVTTFRHEMRIVWIPLARWATASPTSRRIPLNARAGLFLTIRWAMVVAALLIVVPVAPSRCEGDVWVSNIVAYVVLSQVALFSALRIFAIWFKNYTLALITLALGLVRVIVNIYVDGFRSNYSYAGWPVSGCVQNVGFVTTPQIAAYACAPGLYLSRATVIAMDVLVLVLIWAKTYRQWRDARTHLGTPSVVACFLVDGTWYFFVLLALNIADTLTFSTTGSLLSSLTQVLPSVLMNHFIIDLL